MKHLEEQNISERKDLLFQIILIGQSMIRLPQYYFLVIANFIVKLIKK
jgi:hypothetical protein